VGRLLPKILLHTRNRLILCVLDPKKRCVNEIHMVLGMTRHSLASAWRSIPRTRAQLTYSAAI
jgi:hypothetical protein